MAELLAAKHGHLSVSSWNIHGLSAYKQRDVLRVTAKLGVDVLGLVETHLANREQEVQWEEALEEDGSFVWMGKPAVQYQQTATNQQVRGRGSGGVGLLVRAGVQCMKLPECEHPCLHFVGVTPPGGSAVLHVGICYMVPSGSRGYSSNDALLRELEERTAMYTAMGSAVLVMGDFNVHIGTIPSVLSPVTVADEYDPREEFWSGPAGIAPQELRRRSVDACTHAGRAPGVSPDGEKFMERMNAAGLVVLNGLEALGPKAAEATLVSRPGCQPSVIDLMLVDGGHWARMEQVVVEPTAIVDGAASDHHMIRSRYRFDHCTAEGDTPRPPPADIAGEEASRWVETRRYRLRTGGDGKYFKPYAAACEQQVEQLLEEWKAEEARGVHIGVERAWADVKHTLHAAAEATLGAQPKAPGVRPAGRREAALSSPQLRHWKGERRKVLQKIYLLTALKHRTVVEGDGSDVEAAQQATATLAELTRVRRQLDGHVKHFVRRRLRERQLKDLREVQRLRVTEKKEHWRLLKQVGRLHPPRLTVPQTVVDAAGCEHSQPATVRTTWAAAWAALATHVAKDPRYDAAFHHRTVAEIHVQEHIEAERAEAEAEGEPPLTEAQRVAAAALNQPIELRDIREAVRRLKRGKAAGGDGVSAEALKEGGDAILQCLLQLCRKVWERGDVPNDWLRGFIAPLHKDGDKRAPLNYRPITLLSIVGKVYSNVLQARLMAWAEANGVIVEEQGGFRPHRGCPEQVFALTELVKLRRQQRKWTFACFVDIKKAYDTVWQAGLKAKLLKYGVTGRMFNAISSLYAACESSIHLGGELGYTPLFPIETGVRQGCVLSPILYSLFINDLALELKQQEARGIGLPLRERTCRLTVLLYADDIVLLGESAEQLRQLMEVVAAYAHRWRFEVNHSKCGLMAFRPSGSPKLEGRPRLSIGQQVIPWVDSYKYLGIELHSGVPFRRFRARALLAAKRAAGAVAGMGMFSGKLSVPLGLQVYKALVRPQLEYCSEVWSLSPWPDAERVQVAIGRRILGCPQRMSAEAVRGELGLVSMEARFQQARVSFWGRLHCLPAGCPARLVYEDSLLLSERGADLRVPEAEAHEGWQVQYAPAGEHGLTAWAAQVKVDLHGLGLATYWRQPDLLAGMPPGKWNALVRKAVGLREQALWWREAQAKSSLQRVYVPLKQAEARAAGVATPPLKLASYLSMRHGGWNDRTLRGRRLMTALRCGAHVLRICTGRWADLPEAERVCEMCGLAVETELHFVVHCAFRADTRKKLLQQLDAVCGPGGARVVQAAAGRVSGLAAEERLQLVLGSEAARVTAEAATWRQLQARCAVTLVEWMDERQAALAAVEALREEQLQLQRTEAAARAMVLLQDGRAEAAVAAAVAANA